MLYYLRSFFYRAAHIGILPMPVVVVISNGPEVRQVLLQFFLLQRYIFGELCLVFIPVRPRWASAPIIICYRPKWA